MPSQNYIEEIREIWNMVKESFRSELSETSVNLWFGEIEVLSFENSFADASNPSEYTLTLGIPSGFKFNIVKDKRLASIEKKFCQLLGFDVEVNLVFTGSATAGDNIKSQIIGLTPAPKKEEVKNPLDTLSDYNFEYTFENFIVGSTNKFAHAACYAVANRPANYESDTESSLSTYNPLFIYGNSGLGKTHLMHATINRMKENNPDIKIIYTRGEDFTNQMIACLANKTMAEFHEKYRNCDVLLIDDIQFIAGKESTQEEFFHTFSVLYEADKQIILTSDRPPKDINPLEDRLRTRFEGGLIADVQPPNFELRAAIITKKSDAMGLEIEKELIDYLAERLQKDVRQIEGVLKRINAVTSLSGQKVTKEIVDQAISVIDPGNIPTDAMIERILKVVCRHYGISEENIKSKNRTDTVANARHTAIYIIKELTDLTLNEIGNIFGRNHATVIASINKVNTNMRTIKNADADIKRMIKEIKG